MQLSSELRHVMKNTRVTPRVLQGLTGIHYTTIYNILRDNVRPHKINVLTLTKVIQTLEHAKEQGVLPLPRTAGVSDKVEAINSFTKDTD